VGGGGGRSSTRTLGRPVAASVFVDALAVGHLDVDGRFALLMRDPLEQ
jgi:hypothetical protein